MRDLDPQEEPVIRVREVPAVRLPMQRDVVLVGESEQFFQVAGLAHQPIRVIHDHMPYPPRPDRRQQRIPARTLAITPPGGAVVVHEHTPRHDHQAQPLGNLPAQPLLTIHPGLILIPGLRDPAIDRRRLPHPPRRLTIPAPLPGPVTLPAVHDNVVYEPGMFSSSKARTACCGGPS